MGAGRGHREDGSEYCLLYLQLPDISFEHHAHRRASRAQPSHSQASAPFSARPLRDFPKCADANLARDAGTRAEFRTRVVSRRRRQTKDIIATMFRSLALPVDGDELGVGSEGVPRPSEARSTFCACC